MVMAIQVVENEDDIETELGFQFADNWDFAADAADEFWKPDANERCLDAVPVSCTKASAKSACDGISEGGATVLKAEQAAFEPSGHKVVTAGPSDDCSYAGIFYGFGGTGADGLGEGGIDDGGFWASDGADETAGPGSQPFGDVGVLVTCSPQTECSVDRELILNVQQWGSVFYDEGVVLTLVDSGTQCGPGAQIRGLNTYEASKDLADRFDFRNDDVISKVNNMDVLLV